VVKVNGIGGFFRARDLVALGQSSLDHLGRSARSEARFCLRTAKCRNVAKNVRFSART
jgi:hypothetical protein